MADSWIEIERCGPMTSVQDRPRTGVRAYGLSGAGPMDRASYLAAGVPEAALAPTGIEFSAAGMSFKLGGTARVAMGGAGGRFALVVNELTRDWPASLTLAPGDRVSIGPASAGNWGYVRFSREIDVTPVLGSRSTHVSAGIGGLDGRCLAAGDRLPLAAVSSPGLNRLAGANRFAPVGEAEESPLEIPVIWGRHALSFDLATRRAFVGADFTVSSRMDRMGIQLDDAARVFSRRSDLSLVSDATVPGDIQILGDGMPVVLMVEGQTTGGYPRIATLPDGLVDRFAQLRPGTRVRFSPMSLERFRQSERAGREVR